MRYNKLGRTGLLVSEICLGTMTFGGRGMWTSIGTARAGRADTLVARPLDAGINFIDTADVYSEGQSEEITGQAMKNLGVAARSDVVLATKVLGDGGQGANDRGASRGHIMDAVKASLKRLSTDHIDLYQIHGLDQRHADRGDNACARRSRAPGPWYAISASPTGRPGRSSRRSASPTGMAGRARSRCRPTIPSPGATSSARSRRCWKPRRLGLMVWSPLAGGLPVGQI